MTFLEAVTYLDSFVDYEKINSYSYNSSLNLNRIERLLDFLDNPHKEIKAVHIAGTKGKGSTSVMVAAILKEAGFRVGLYTSPHLESFRERIRILDRRLSEEEISRESISSLVANIAPYADKLRCHPQLGELSFFELYTALAFLYFKREAVDFMVLEVGIGGRLDATNVVRPLVCGITPISLEHRDKLGNTLEAIAREKAGIIKENDRLPVVSAIQEEAVSRVLADICRERKARLFEVGKDIFYEEVGGDLSGQVFNIKGLLREYPLLKLGLLGEHQLVNAASAVGIIEALSFYGITVSLPAVKKGLEGVRWPGRLEVVLREPTIVLDGAQNIASAVALGKAIKRFFTYDKLILVLGISQDKDIGGISRHLAGLSDYIILTKADNKRAADPALIKGFMEGRKDISLTGNVKEALALAKSKAKKEDLILVTGSLFVVGEARGICNKTLNPKHETLNPEQIQNPKYKCPKKILS